MPLHHPLAGLGVVEAIVRAQHDAVAIFIPSLVIIGDDLAIERPAPGPHGLEGHLGTILMSVEAGAVPRADKECQLLQLRGSIRMACAVDLLRRLRLRHLHETTVGVMGGVSHRPANPKNTPQLHRSPILPRNAIQTMMLKEDQEQ